MTPYWQHPTLTQSAWPRASAHGGAAVPTSRRWLSLAGIAAGVFVLVLLLSPTGAPPAAAQSTPTAGTRLPSGAWTQRIPATGPTGLAGHTMAYDEARQEVVLFGGDSETWTWNGSAWTQRTNAANPVSGATPLGVPAPPERTGHAMAYDAVRNEVVLFGGYGGVGSLRSDTWVWNGSTWTQRTPRTSPGPLANHAMAYDPISKRVILFGGISQQYDPRGTSVPQPNNATWLWDGTNWTRANTAASRTPPARLGHAMAFGEAVIDRKPITVNGVVTGYTERTTFEGVILFGGRSQLSLVNSARNDMWVWDGGSWFDQSAVLRARTGSEAAIPGGRSGHAIAYDSDRRELVVVGGIAGATMTGVTAARDTWVWGNDDVKRDLIWEQDTAFPQARAGHAMAYDAARKQFVLVGGGDPAGLNPQRPGLIGGPDDGAWVFTRAGAGDHGTVPLHRLFNGATDGYLYTVNPAERDAAVAGGGFVSEGITAYVWDADPDGDDLAGLGPSIVPLYRLDHAGTGDLFYTTDASERDAAVRNYGYVAKGIVAYVSSAEGPGISGLTPLYRLYNGARFSHFYTTSASERDAAIQTRGYVSEGIAAYVVPADGQRRLRP